MSTHGTSGHTTLKQPETILRLDVESTLCNVDLTLIQRFDIESMLNRRCFNVVCLLGEFSAYADSERLDAVEHLWDYGNLFETGYFEPLRVNHSTRSGSKWEYFRVVFSIFYRIVS